MKLYFWRSRISHSVLATVMMVFIFFWPLAEPFYYLYVISLGGRIPTPDYAFYLTVNSAGIGHVFQSLWVWFMPFYLTILLGEIGMEDVRTGYCRIMLSKMGKKRYVKSYLKGSFMVTFILIFGALSLNLLLVHIMFAGGTGSPYSVSDQDSVWLLFQYEHPFAANLFFLLITSIVISVLAVSCTMVSLTFQNRKTVYAVNVILWLSFVLKKQSIVLLFQPFSEYSLQTLGLIAIEFGICYSGFTLVLYIMEVHGKNAISLA